MKLEILNAAVVVLAREHNISILHPAFLSAQNIVPKDWKEAEPSLCTPVYSTVKYTNQIAFSVEPQKFQVMDNNPPKNVAASQIAQLAIDYTEALPHVHYDAVGINFQAFLVHRDAEKFLLEHFLKKNACNKGGQKPQSAGLQLVYPLADARFRLSLDGGTVQKNAAKTSRAGILISGNYHVDVRTKKTVPEVKEALGRFEQRSEHFKTLVGKLFSLEN